MSPSSGRPEEQREKRHRLFCDTRYQPPRGWGGGGLAGSVSLCITEGVKGGKRTPPTLQHSPVSSTAAFNIHLRCTRFVLEVANNGGSNKLQSGVKRKRETMALSWEKTRKNNTIKNVYKMHGQQLTSERHCTQNCLFFLLL